MSSLFKKAQSETNFILSYKFVIVLTFIKKKKKKFKSPVALGLDAELTGSCSSRTF